MAHCRPVLREHLANAALPHAVDLILLMSVTTRSAVVSTSPSASRARRRHSRMLLRSCLVRRHWLVFPVRQGDSDPTMVQRLHAVLQLLALAQAQCQQEGKLSQLSNNFLAFCCLERAPWLWRGGRCCPTGHTRRGVCGPRWAGRVVSCRDPRVVTIASSLRQHALCHTQIKLPACTHRSRTRIVRSPTPPPPPALAASSFSQCALARASGHKW
jgi:hypothetical protein